MGVKETSSNKIGWQVVHNKVDEKTIDGSLAHTLKPTKKIRRRTKALNLELKRFAALRSYSHYVSIKTAILRDISDDDDTDDDVGNRSNKLELRGNASSPLVRTYDASTIARTLDSADDELTEALARKRRKKAGRSLNDDSNSAGKHIDKKRGGKNNNIARTDSATRSTRIMTSTRRKNPANVKKNLTFVWDSLEDVNDPSSASRMASPVAQSTQIWNGENNFGVCDDADSSKVHNNKYRCRKKSKAKSQVHDACDTVDELESLATDEIPGDDDAESNVERATKLVEENEADDDGAVKDEQIPKLAEENEADDDGGVEDEQISELVEGKGADDDVGVKDEEADNEDARVENKQTAKLAVTAESDGDCEPEHDRILKMAESEGANDDDARLKNKRMKKLAETEESDNDAELETQQPPKLSESNESDDDNEQLVMKWMEKLAGSEESNDDAKLEAETKAADDDDVKLDNKRIKKLTKSKETDDAAELEGRQTCEPMKSEESDVNDDANVDDEQTRKFVESPKSENGGKLEGRQTPKLAESEEPDHDDEVKANNMQINKLSESEDPDDDDEVKVNNTQVKKLSESEESDDEEPDDKKMSKLSESSDRNEEKTHSQDRSESNGISTKRSQPIITCTEIVKDKYTIHRDDCKPMDADPLVQYPIREEPQSEDDCTAREETNEVMSPQTKRLSQLKRFNLITNSSESEDSEYEEENEDDKRGHCNADKKNTHLSRGTSIDEADDSEDETVKPHAVPRSSLSQVISDPSDSDDSIHDSTKIHNETEILKKSSLVDSTTRTVTKSFKSQIREQENFRTSDVTDNANDIGEATIKKTKKKEKKRKKETAEPDVDTNLTSNNDAEDEIDNGVSLRNESPKRWSKKNLACSMDDEFEEDDEETRKILPRPLELSEYVDRVELVANQQPSTMTAKQLNAITQDNSDEEIWLMEIPRSVIGDGNKLCGTKIALKSGKITMNGITYKTTSRDEKSVSCLLRKSEKKSRYKTVNLDPVGYIIVRQESPDPTLASSSHNTSSAVRSNDRKTQSPVTVPFPKNLKSRNPLLGQDDCRENVDFDNVKNKASSMRKQKRKRRFDEDGTSGKIRKKVESKIWNIDNFLLDDERKVERREDASS